MTNNINHTNNSEYNNNNNNDKDCDRKNNNNNNNNYHQFYKKSKLYEPKIRLDQIPIIYRDEYNIDDLPFSDIHRYSPKRWKSVKDALRLTNESRLVSPNEASRDVDLPWIHTDAYLTKLDSEAGLIAKIIGVPQVATLNIHELRYKLLKPFKYQTGGSVLAGKLAMERGWAINLGGGFHHAHRETGAGFCFYADVTLTVNFLLAHYPERVRKVMIIDLDAHQGNGVARDFAKRDDVYILDIFNQWAYPFFDQEAFYGAVKSGRGITNASRDDFSDRLYLRYVKENLEYSLTNFNPDFVIYIAGTALLKYDVIGGNMNISKDGIIKRDEIVFKRIVQEEKIPIAMLMAGGLNESVFAQSILNLNRKGLIDLGPLAKTSLWGWWWR